MCFINLWLFDESPGEFHSKSSDTPDTSSGLSSLYHHIHYVTDYLRFILSECCVDLEVGFFTECFFTEWTFVGLTVVPALVQAALTEVVSTWSADWISEQIQTDRTLELL